MNSNYQILQVRNLNLRLGELWILNDINFTISVGEIFVVIGPNGGGKTSLAKIIAGIVPPTTGEVIISKGITIGYVPQKLKLEKMMPISVERFLKIYSPEGQDNKIVKTFMEDAGVTKLLSKKLYDLSGGQLQRIMLAGALLKNPNLLILDEPMQGLDIDGQAKFYELIEALNQKEKISIFMISHDLQMVMRQANNIICLNHHICCQGKAHAILDNPNYNNLFGKKVLSSIGAYTHIHTHSHDI